MSLLTLDHIIVYIFLAITLAVGLYYGRGIKTLRNFAVADRSYSATIITITLIATMIGAGTVIVDVIEAIDSNFLYAFSLLGLVFGIVLFSNYYAPKFDTRFRECISIGDVLGKFLNKSESKIACFIMFLNCMGMLGAQLIVMGYLCKSFLGLSYELSVVLTSGIIILYSTFGGIRSVTMTDVLQFFVLAIAIPLISAMLLKKTQINTHDIALHFQSMFSNKVKVIDYFALAAFWMVPLNFLNASVIQRYLMVKSMNVKLSKITLSFALMKALMLLMLLVTVICFLKLHPFSNSSEIMSIILQNHIPIGFSGLVLSGIIAVIMSSADSGLNALSVLFVKNILPKSMVKCDKRALLLTKITTLIIGIAALLMALQNFKPVTLMVYAHTLLVGGSSIPLMMGLFGFKVNRESFWICLFTAGATYTISKYTLSEFKYIHSLFTLITSVAAFFISHYIINGSFAFDPNMKPQPPQALRKEPLRIPSFRQIEKTICRKFSKKSTSLTLFASFCYMNFLYCLFLFAIQGKDYMNVSTLFIIGLSAVLCTLLLFKELWGMGNQKKYLAKAWLFCLCYCIPFISTVLLAATNGAMYPVILFTIGLLLLSYLVNWFLFSIISIAGVTLGCLFELAISGEIYIDVPIHTIVASILSLIIVSIVIKMSQNETEEQIKTLELFGGAMAHEAKSPMSSFVMNNYLLKDITEECIVLEHDEDNYKIQLSTHQYEMFKELPSLNDTIGRNGCIAVNLLLLAMRTDEMREVEDFDEYSVKDCVDETMKEYVIDKKQKSLVNIEVKQDFTFKGSKTFMKATIINLIKNAFRHGGRNVNVNILIDKDKLIVRDNGKGIPADKIERIFEKYYTGHKEGTGIGLALCDKFMDSIGGNISCTSKVGEFTKFTLEFASESEG